MKIHLKIEETYPTGHCFILVDENGNPIENARLGDYLGHKNVDGKLFVSLSILISEDELYRDVE